MAKGVQANWIHRGAPRPANPVKRHPAKSVWTVVILIMILDVDVTAEGGIIKLFATSRGNERYEGKKQRVIYFRYHFGVFPLWWLITRMLFMPYDIESQSRNADFILIARKGDTTTLGLKGRQT